LCNSATYLMCERFHAGGLLIVFCMLREQGLRDKIVGTIIVIYPSCACDRLAGEEKYWPVSKNSVLLIILMHWRKILIMWFWLWRRG
ncbi:hypothetical protein, partial [Candidatus Erwinia dacicola]|uniref:hypothetical protein n=1 Tax=Candidatus Erwinia dacicola TaxID=252393 RepID=UPI001C98F315